MLSQAMACLSTESHYAVASTQRCEFLGTRRPLSARWLVPAAIQRNPFTSRQTVAKAAALPDKVTLRPGVHMPLVGLGTYQIPEDRLDDAVRTAILEAGYRHIDCAAVYGNEAHVGKVLAACLSQKQKPLRREELFIVSKLWNNRWREVRAAAEQSLADLQLSHLDCYMVHWPLAWKEGSLDKDDRANIKDTWLEMEKLQEAGLTRTIAVSNFTLKDLRYLLSFANIPPVINQVEVHPYLQQREMLAFCADHGMRLVAYAPLGQAGVLSDADVVDVAAKLGKTPAQVILRWNVERGVAVIPKSLSLDRLKKNISVFDFSLPPDAKTALDGLDRGHRFVNPDWANFDSNFE